MGKRKLRMDPRVQRLVDSITLPKEIRQSSTGHYFLYVNDERIACVSSSSGPSGSERIIRQNIVDIKKFLKQLGGIDGRHND